MMEALPWNFFSFEVNFELGDTGAPPLENEGLNNGKPSPLVIFPELPLAMDNPSNAKLSAMVIDVLCVVPDYSTVKE